MTGYSALISDFASGNTPIFRRPITQSDDYDSEDGIIMFMSYQDTFDAEDGDIISYSEFWQSKRTDANFWQFNDEDGLTLGHEGFWAEWDKYKIFTEEDDFRQDFLYDFSGESEDGFILSIPMSTPKGGDAYSFSEEDGIILQRDDDLNVNKGFYFFESEDGLVIHLREG